jgi:hypothetical protein
VDQHHGRGLDTTLWRHGVAMRTMTRAQTRTTPDRATRQAVTGQDIVVERNLARQGIRAIDSVLDAVERHHLARRPRDVPPRPDWIARLKEGGLTVPTRILLLRDTVQLHGALMDWQEELLSAALPGRANFTRADERDGVDEHR